MNLTWKSSSRKKVSESMSYERMAMMKTCVCVCFEGGGVFFHIKVTEIPLISAGPLISAVLADLLLVRLSRHAEISGTSLY